MLKCECCKVINIAKVVSDVNNLLPFFTQCKSKCVKFLFRTFYSIIKDASYFILCRKFIKSLLLIDLNLLVFMNHKCIFFNFTSYRFFFVLAWKFVFYLFINYCNKCSQKHMRSKNGFKNCTFKICVLYCIQHA